jgi:hypothetical protein
MATFADNIDGDDSAQALPGNAMDAATQALHGLLNYADDPTIAAPVAQAIDDMIAKTDFEFNGLEFVAIPAVLAAEGTPFQQAMEQKWLADSARVAAAKTTFSTGAFIAFDVARDVVEYAPPGAKIAHTALELAIRIGDAAVDDSVTRNESNMVDWKMSGSDADELRVKHIETLKNLVKDNFDRAAQADGPSSTLAQTAQKTVDYIDQKIQALAQKTSPPPVLNP